MLRHVMFSSFATCVVSGQIAVAQTGASLVSTAPRLIATTSFAPYQEMGTLGNAELPLNLQGVSLDWSTKNADGGVDLGTGHQSFVQLNAQSVPSGAYSIQFAFSRVYFATTITLSQTLANGATTVVKSCSLVPPAATSPCDTGILSVPDGHLNVTLSVSGVQGAHDNARLVRVTVSQWTAK